MERVIEVEASTHLLAGLLDRSHPALRFRVLTDLLELPADDSRVEKARTEVRRDPWVRATLAAHHGDGTWGRGFYHKYDGTSWVLLHLSEVGAPMDLPEIDAGVQRLLRTARSVLDIKGDRGLPFADVDEGAYWTHPIVCLTAHMALVLVRAGLIDHPTTRAALGTCRHRFRPRRGFGCFVLAPSLLPACVMTVPKVLKALLAIPPPRRTNSDEGLVEALVEVMKRFHLIRYVPRASKAWREESRDMAPDQRAEEKARWIREGRMEPRSEKASWLDFSFPHTYNTDLLEVLLLLGEAGIKRDEVVEDGLRRLVEARRPDGTWPMRRSPVKGRMHADLETRGPSSPWITYRSLLALKRFGALELPDGAHVLD